MPWVVEEIPDLKGYTVEWAENGNYFLSRRNVVYHSADLKPPFTKITSIGTEFWRRLAAYPRLGQRLLRFMVTNILPLKNGDLFVTFDKSVGVIQKRHYTELKGMFRPCRVLRGAAAVDQNGDVFFGEYLANPDRGEMRIYRYKPASRILEAAYVFGAGSIRHIHGLYFDPITNALFCLTGDDDQECRILRSSDGCRTFEVVGEGDESWRAVSVLFKQNSFYYGTDAEFRTNHLYQVDRESLERRIMGEVSGTAFYSKSIDRDLFFTTTAENAPSQKENVAALWHVDQNGNCIELAKYEKDKWHKALFGFGTIHLPNMGNNLDRLYFHLVGVEGDNRCFVIHRT
jgi:hypothetical protein